MNPIAPLFPPIEILEFSDEVEQSYDGASSDDLPGLFDDLLILDDLHRCAPVVDEDVPVQNQHERSEPQEPPALLAQK